MWRFLSPHVVFGEDSTEHLEKFEKRRTVIITDEVIKDLGYADDVSKHLENSEAITIRAKEPCIDDVLELAERMRESDPEVIIALGGGSVMDAAKAGRILMEAEIEPEEITPFTDLEDYGFKGKTTLVAVPTTSGTGSEATWAIVLKDLKERRKVVMANEKVMPDIALVDPAFVYSMPEHLVISGGFDALSHAIEAFLSSFSNPFSDSLALNSARLILDSFVMSFRGDRGARDRMHISATMAGIAFSNSQVGAVHALAHAAGAMLDIPHGIAVGAFLNPVLEFYRERGVERLSEMSKNLGTDILKEIERFEIEFRLTEHIPAHEIESHRGEIVERAMEDSCIVTGPFVPEEDDIENIIERVVRRCMREES